MNRAKRRLLLSLLVTTVATSSLAAADAAHNWTQHCVRCHGSDGKGTTKIGRKLKVKDLSSERTQNRLSDEDIADLIAHGYKDNDGEERMPAFADKLSGDERNQLVAFIRSLKNGAR